MVGAVYDAMQEAGLSDETYFVFSSDHGEMAMEHQDWYKMSMYEPSVRVPLVMTGPEIQQDHRVSNLVSLIDLCPAFLEMAELPARRDLDGESLLPLAAGRTAASRNWAYASFTGCSGNTSAYMLRKDRWKYIAYAGFPPQLFDMQNDARELADLSDDRPDVVERLDADLRSVVDYDQTHRDWTAYCKDAFRQWRQEAVDGQHVDDSYSLAGNPSSDYWTIMDNCFTGYDQGDEAIVNRWLDDE
jgi:arylsulfatase K